MAPLPEVMTRYHSDPPRRQCGRTTDPEMSMGLKNRGPRSKGSRSLLAAVLLCVTASASADVDPSLFQDLHWRTIGPFRAGRVLAAAGVPGDAKHFYFG